MSNLVNTNSSGQLSYNLTAALSASREVDNVPEPTEVTQWQFVDLTLALKFSWSADPQRFHLFNSRFCIVQTGPCKLK